MGAIDDILAGQQKDKLANVTGEDALKHLVGDDAKYKTVEDMAKAALAGQLHINDLEVENKTFRETQDKAKGIEDILAALKGQTPPVEPLAGLPPVADQQPPEAPKDTSVADQIAAAFKSRDDVTAAGKAEANQKDVAAQVAKLYGDNAGKVFDDVAAKLGIDLNELAKQSPLAVLKLVADARPASNTSEFDSTINPGVPVDTSTRESIAAQYKAGTIDRYQKIALENAALTRLGDKYFD